MNAAVHAELSCKFAKTKSDKDFKFFYSVHDFIDSSKEVESSNLHRAALHHLWGLKRVIVPIFGHTYICENGTKVNLKDDLEKSHLLADNKNKFIAAISDYVSLISPDSGDQELFTEFQRENHEFFIKNTEIEELMMSPLANTGMISSLFITHNSWFIGSILPIIFPNVKIKIKNSLSPSIFFNRMRMDSWVNNGAGTPPSSIKILEYRKSQHKSLDLIAPLEDTFLTKTQKHLID